MADRDLEIVRRKFSPMALERLDRDLSLAAVSKKTGIARQYVNEIELGKHFPGAPIILALSEVFGLSFGDMAELLFRTWQWGREERAA